MNTPYSYSDTLAASEKVNWRIEDIIGGDKMMDFSKPFLPESFARVSGLNFLSPYEQLTLNQIRAFDYLCTFGLVEEFILPFVLDHARPQLNEDDHRTRAFLKFAGEEAKHIHLFKCFRKEFEEKFGSRCDYIGPAEEISAAVLDHHPLAIAITILHIEWMTQRHYTDSVKDDQELDPQFKSLLKHHWMEEAQHAKLDANMVSTLAESMTAAEIDSAIGEYLEIGGFLDAGLMQQVTFNTESFVRVTGREFTTDEVNELTRTQQQAVRWTFLGSGMSHPKFKETIEAIKPGAYTQIEKVVPAFS